MTVPKLSFSKLRSIGVPPRFWRQSGYGLHDADTFFLEHEACERELPIQRVTLGTENSYGHPPPLADFAACLGTASLCLRAQMLWSVCKQVTSSSSRSCQKVSASLPALCTDSEFSASTATSSHRTGSRCGATPIGLKKVGRSRWRMAASDSATGERGRSRCALRSMRKMPQRFVNSETSCQRL